MIQRPRGTVDVLPWESYKWQWLEEKIREITKVFGYREIRTPVFEHTELFERGVGDTTDIVEKEMYTFFDKGDRSITLKPEGTAPTARAYIEHKMHGLPQPVKMYYLTKIYRYERPQAGRLREHTQFGIEAFGGQNPQIDVEVINVALTLFNKLGIKDLRVNINSIGCKECRGEYKEKLIDYFKTMTKKLCQTCNKRMEKNPLRIFDCKNDDCKKVAKDAPKIVDHTCPECHSHFEEVKKLLTLLEVNYTVNPFIVRGLDYYTKTVFEIIYDGLGAQSTVCGGGRYDGLTKEIGGADIPAVGFGMGMERLLLTLESQNLLPKDDAKLDVFIAAIGQYPQKTAFKLMADLRSMGISTQKDYSDKGLKSQMKLADKYNAKLTVILGEDEINSGKALIKEMEKGTQMDVEIDKLIETIQHILKGATRC